MTPKDSAMMGVISGAMIMAPIIAGALLARSPNVAMALDSTAGRKNFSRGWTLLSWPWRLLL
jgi:hypothetical protein